MHRMFINVQFQKAFAQNCSSSECDNNDDVHELRMQNDRFNNGCKPKRGQHRLLSQQLLLA